MERFLSEQKIEAVIVTVPIHLLHSVVKECLKAGKHVLSEKPISSTIQEARSLLSFYRQQEKEREKENVVWGVAENYRWEGAFLCAREWLPSSPLSFQLRAFLTIAPDNKVFLFFIVVLSSLSLSLHLLCCECFFPVF